MYVIPGPGAGTRRHLEWCLNTVIGSENVSTDNLLTLHLNF